MKLTLAMAVVLGLGGTALADDTCFEVSADGRTWSKTPEVLCVASVKDADYTLTLRTGIPGAQHEVMTLHLNLLNRVRCLDCNKDVFGIANPTNSVANALQVKFDGKRDPKSLEEKGTVRIGATRLFYRGRTAAAPPPPLGKTPPPVDKKNPDQSPPTHQPPPSQ